MFFRISTAGLSHSQLKSDFELDFMDYFSVRLNNAISHPIPTIWIKEGKQVLTMMRWGFEREWSPDLFLSKARLETIDSRRNFHLPFLNRRCIVPVSGFYEQEWPVKGRKYVYVYHKDEAPLFFAGIWDYEYNKTVGSDIQCCTIINVPASRSLKAIHNRMPAILKPEYFSQWLNPQFNDIRALKKIASSDEDMLKMHYVSDYVSDERHNGWECIEPI